MKKLGLLFLCFSISLQANLGQVQLSLSPTFVPDLVKAIEQAGPAFERNVDSFFIQLGTSLPKMNRGMIQFGHGLSQAIAPMQKRIIIGTLVAYTALTAGYLVKQACSKYITKYMFEPALIEKQSSRTFWSTIKSWFTSTIKLEDHMVISDELLQDLNYLIAMTKNIKKNGGQFENVLLYGEPGTGKTLFAQLLAQSCGMDYAFVPAANVSQFLANGTVVTELNQLFEWAAKSKRGTIIFFDEADTFLAKRETLNAMAQNALGAFLAKTGTPSNKIMIICATNRPEALDKAVLTRLGMKIEFPLPDLQARQDQLIMHIEKIFGHQAGMVVNYDCLKNPEYIATVAAKLEGCSGRIIQQFVNRLRQMALAQNQLILDIPFVENVITQLHNSSIA